MAIATQLHNSSDRANVQAQTDNQSNIKLLKSRWSGGRAYLPIISIILLLSISLVVIRLHSFGLTLLRVLRGGIRQTKLTN